LFNNTNNNSQHSADTVIAEIVTAAINSLPSYMHQQCCCYENHSACSVITVRK